METLELHESRIKESEKVSNVKERKQQSKKTTVAAVSKRLVNSGFDYKTFITCARLTMVSLRAV